MILLSGLPCLAASWDSYKLVLEKSPLEVLSNGEADAARRTLATLEQHRHLLAKALGKQELQPLWPVRVTLLPADRTYSRHRSPVFRLSRDNYVASVAAREPLPPQLLRQFAFLLLEGETRRLPAEIEEGLADVLSTLEAEGTRVTIGKAPPKERMGRNWARMHLLVVDPEYAGRVRVFFAVMQSGAALDLAYRNAFESTSAKMEAEVDRYFSAAQFTAQTIGGRPLNPDRDIRRRELEDAAARVALADLLPEKEAQKEFLSLVNSSIKAPETLEGAGLYGEAVAAGSASAMAWYRHGLALAGSDAGKAREALQKAAELNPRWAEPHVRIAELENDLARQIPRWKKAVELQPRNSAYWESLADAQTRARLYADATRSWREAEQAAGSDGERARIRDRRESYDRRRAELEAAERKRQADEEAQELERLRQEALERVRAAEKKATAGVQPLDPKTKVVEWWEGPRAEGRAAGTLTAVECVKGKARLVIRSGGTLTRLLVADPGKVVVMGKGELTLGCGPQKPARQVNVEFTPRVDKALGTAGDVALVEFQ